MDRMFTTSAQPVRMVQAGNVCYLLGHYTLMESTKPFTIVNDVLNVTVTYTWVGSDRMFNYTQGPPNLILQMPDRFPRNLAPGDTMAFDFVNSSTVHSINLYLTYDTSPCAN